jgi:hypothetical protein
VEIKNESSLMPATIEVQTLEKLAEFHNAAVDRGNTPGKWMADNGLDIL